LEHFTVPPHLCALYSIKNETRPEARIIRTVAIEEMLHMIMAANILNDIGGDEPKIHSKEVLPHYPSPMPHSSIGEFYEAVREALITAAFLIPQGLRLQESFQP
jgi:hypothetical protein